MCSHSCAEMKTRLSENARKLYLVLRVHLIIHDSAHHIFVAWVVCATANSGIEWNLRKGFTKS